MEMARSNPLKRSFFVTPIPRRSGAAVSKMAGKHAFTANGMHNQTLISSHDLAPPPSPSPLPVSRQWARPVTHRKTEATYWRERGVGGGAKSYNGRESVVLYKSFNTLWSHLLKAGSLKMNTALEYSTRVVQEGGRRCKKSTLNDLVHLTPLRIPLMNPPCMCKQTTQNKK